MATTIMDVARKAGVAHSTVSLALRGVGKVAPATREKILQAAEALNYRADAAASVMAGRRTYEGATRQRLQVAYLHQTRENNRREKTFQGAQAECDRLGYGLEELTLDRVLREGPAAARELWQRGVDGIIVGTLGSIPPFDFPWERFALVKIRRVLPWLSVDLVRVSAPEMLITGLNAIIERGYRSVLCLLMPTASIIDDDLRLGTLYAYSRRHLPEGVRLNWDEMRIDQSPETAARLRKLITRHKPDAVLGFTSAFYQALRRGGYRMPEDFAYAAFPLHGQTGGEGQSRFFAGVEERAFEQGAMAMRHLHELITKGQRGPVAPPAQYLLSSVWLDGDSVPAPG